MLFADRLEVWNPGELPLALTIPQLRRPHASIPRNPLIADPMFLARYAEKAGSGILDMIARCKQAGLPAPEFRQEGGQFIQTLGRPAPQVTPQVEAQEAQEAQVEAQVELTVLEKQLLMACQAESRSGQELIEAAGYAGRTGNFKRSLEKVLDAQLLAMTIPDKPTSSLQKYRLTDKGRAWLASKKTKGGPP